MTRAGRTTGSLAATWAGGIGRPGQGREARGGRRAGAKHDGDSLEGNLAEELGVRNTHG